MTSAEDRNNLVTAQEKLEWVTPQWINMEVTSTDGKIPTYTEGGGSTAGFGPS